MKATYVRCGGNAASRAPRPELGVQLLECVHEPAVDAG